LRRYIYPINAEAMCVHILFPQVRYKIPLAGSYNVGKKEKSRQSKQNVVIY
jgi:hypothetical protein